MIVKEEINIKLNRINQFLGLLFFVFILFINFGNSYNICSTNLSEPWFSIKDNSSEELLIVDSSGDIFFRGKSHLNNINNNDSVRIGNMYFSKFNSYFNLDKFYSKKINFTNLTGLIIRNNLSEIVAVFSNDGIYTKGVGLYQGSQANCNDDGMYCNGVISENRDYYCSIEGNKLGNCNYNIRFKENCNLKLTMDSDSGKNYFVSGKLIDYGGCSNGNCLYNRYNDYCQGNILTEYYSTGASFNVVKKDCKDYEYNYCVGNNEVWHNNFGCGSGSCVDLPDVKVIDCKVTETKESSWGCYNNFRRFKVVTEYFPTCFLGSCGEESKTTKVFEDAPSGYYCSGGIWKKIRDCNGYWNNNYGACSVSCGGGNYDKKFIVTQNPTPGGKSCPTPSFYNNGGNVCNTQSCYSSWNYYDSCFLEGTKITLWNYSYKNIEDININDKILSYNEDTSKFQEEIVLDIEMPMREGYYMILFNDSTIINITDEHPIYIFRNNSFYWASINPFSSLLYDELLLEKLDVGDKVLTDKNKFKEIEGIFKFNKLVRTYNLKSISNTHTFFANSILVHNKDDGSPSGGGIGNSAGYGGDSFGGDNDVGSSSGTDSGGGSWSCFSKGTKVKVFRNNVLLNLNIEEVKIGDYLLGNNSINLVLEYDRPKTNGRKLYSINNNDYFVTKEHMFLTPEGWKSIDSLATKRFHPSLFIELNMSLDNLKIGDYIYELDSNNTKKIVRIFNISSIAVLNNTQLYNFKLSGDHTYIANNFIVHNK